MAIHDVEKVDLSELTNRHAVVITSVKEDGCEMHVTVDVIGQLGRYTYGHVMACEQIAPGHAEVRDQPVLSRHVARFPLEGTLNRGVVNLDITPNAADHDHRELRTRSLQVLAKAEYSEVPVECKTLRFVERSSY